MNNQEWRTPKWLFDACEKVCGPFDVDLCASDDWHLCDTYYTKERPLTSSGIWPGFCWVNPPYNHRDLESIMRKVEDCANRAVCLVPANKTDQTWWHDYVVLSERAKVVYIKGRVGFLPVPGVSESSPRYPVCLVLYGEHEGNAIRLYTEINNADRSERFW